MTAPWALIVLTAWALLIIAHADDRFAVTHVSGARMALAQYADHGELYPPLYRDGYFGGTRFMPVPILLHAGLAKLTGEYLVSGKIVSYVSMAFLLWTLIAALRRVGCPWQLALAITAGVLATQVSILVGLGIWGDALPAALQLLALNLVARTIDKRALHGAAVLSAVALLSKQSALWAPAAIAMWLWRRDRQALFRFVFVYLMSSVAGLLFFQALTHGRFLANIIGLSFSGESLANALIRPFGALGLLVTRTGPVFLIALLAVAEIAFAVSRRAPTLYDYALVAAFAVLFVVMTDIGADYNHLIDVVVLGGISAARLWTRLPEPHHSMAPWRPILTAVICGSLVAGSLITLLPLVAGAFHADPAYAKQPLAGLVGSQDRILSEDPSIPVELGERPVVLDAFMVPRIGARHPEWIADLVRRIQIEEFDEIILLRRLDRPGAAHWYATWHFGTKVASAIQASYRLEASRDGYFLYVPGLS